MLEETRPKLDPGQVDEVLHLALHLKANREGAITLEEVAQFAQEAGIEPNFVFEAYSQTTQVAKSPPQNEDTGSATTLTKQDLPAFAQWFALSLLIATGSAMWFPEEFASKSVIPVCFNAGTAVLLVLLGLRSIGRPARWLLPIALPFASFLAGVFLVLGTAYDPGLVRNSEWQLWSVPTVTLLQFVVGLGVTGAVETFRRLKTLSAAQRPTFSA